VVSLYDVLKFAANDFVWIMHELLVFIFDPRIAKTQDGSNRLFNALSQSRTICEKLVFPQLSSNMSAYTQH